MPDYHVFVRVEPQQQPGKGAKRGEVVSIRPAETKATNTEKKRLLVLKVSMTNAEYLIMQSQVRPQALFLFIGTPPTDPKEREAWNAAMDVECKKLHVFGLTVDFNTLGLNMSAVDDPKVIVKPVAVTKDKLAVKPAKAVL